MKKIFAITICLIIAVAACFGLVACGDTDDNEGGQSTPTRDDSAWFSQEELSARGLANLPAPQNLTGKINTDIMWSFVIPEEIRTRKENILIHWNVICSMD